MTRSLDDRTPSSPTEPRRPARTWLLGALPALAFLATFGFFFLDKSREARTVFKSGRGLLTVAVIVGGYLALGFVLRRFVRWSWVAPAVLTTIVLGLAAWIVRPYYVDETSNRRLVEGPVADAPVTTAPPAGGVPAATTPQPQVAMRISSGEIQGLGHRAEGRVSVIRDPDGSLVVRFESFDLEGTPDPRVYVVEGRDAREPDGMSLGRLRGNRGSVLDYPVPAGRNPGADWTVLVWCERFSVPIANATQAAA